MNKIKSPENIFPFFPISLKTNEQEIVLSIILNTINANILPSIQALSACSLQSSSSSHTCHPGHLQLLHQL